MAKPDKKPGKDLSRPVRPDIEFTASVRSMELRFDEVPETSVTFFGDPAHESVWGTERENLPDRVEPGVVYRESSVRLRIASRLVHPQGDPDPPASAPDGGATET